MPLQKQNLSVNFSQGLDTKTDPNQVQPGKFVKLVNSVFTKGGLLTKRNGFGSLTAATGTPASIGTFKDTLVSIGSTLESFNSDANIWTSAGSIATVDLSTVPLVRTSTSQTMVDAAIAANGLICETWKDSAGNAFYQVSDSVTGNSVKLTTALESTATNCRVFCLGQYFIVTYHATVSASPHLRYVAIPIYNPASPTTAADISTTVESITSGYDGVVANNRLYLAYSASDAGGAVRVTFLGTTLAQGNTAVLAGHNALKVSVVADVSQPSPIIWVTYLAKTSNNTYTQAYNTNLSAYLTVTTVYTGIAFNNLTSSATGNVLTILTEVAGTYSYSPNAVTNHVDKITVTSTGTVGSSSTIKRGVGLASKSFLLNSTMYSLITYGQAYQPTYFLMDTSGNLIARLAYSNGGGYITQQVLPSISISGDKVSIAYLYVDLLVPVNKTQGSTKVVGIYTQTGINLVTFDFSAVASMVEIGNNLHITGGFLQMYDGNLPVEHGFHVWPEDIAISTSTAGGSITNQIYYYVAVYEWTDAQGNIHRSAPSVPMAITTTGAGTSTNTINVPMLRLTTKTNVRIVLYRWSTAQQSYYQVSTVASPNINVPTSDSIAITDTSADSSILGNNLLYTTGGVIDNIAAPATSAMTLYKSRLFTLDSEDRNLIKYSKQVVETVPAEMSDLLSLYVAPTIGSQGSTGPITCLANMDDKLIIFKANAIYYITGQGPDNTGAQNDFSDPIFITSTAGCTNPKSVISTPYGVMFQSNKGIWILKRDMSTEYVGAPVEAFNSYVVNSALTIPGTNQVRFMLTGISSSLVYDYYYGQWSEFQSIPSVTSTLYGSLHTYLSDSGLIMQETVGAYLDGSIPVNLSFTTGWMSMSGLQGYERIYAIYLLAKYLTPHLLTIGLAYDYDSSIVQSIQISPDNFTPNYGGEALYGGGEAYSASQFEQWQINPGRQKCQSFQITLTERYDMSQGVAAGAGLTLSAMNLLMGAKKGYAPKAAAASVG